MKMRVAHNQSPFENMLGESFSESLMEQGIDKGVEVNMYVYKDDQTLHVGTAIVSDADQIHNGPQGKLHNRDLPETEEEDHIVLKKISI